MKVERTFCRLCHCACPIDAEIEEGVVRRIRGADGNDTFRGYTCAKGRAYPSMHQHPERLLRSQKRQANGSFASIDVTDALDEIAERLEAIKEEHGPRAIALYLGTQTAANPATGPLAYSWLAALGSKMSFNALTIDCPGKLVAYVMHGLWRAPAQNFDEPDAILVVGANPIVANHMGLPSSNPGRWLKDQRKRGCELLVMDPRRTETARIADIHLQIRPGTDAPVLAAMIKAVFDAGHADDEFLASDVSGANLLKAAVEPFTIEAVARHAGIESAKLAEAAAVWGRAKRGYSAVGTGPNMNGPGSTLTEYLALSLMTICGRWLRAGERVQNPGALLPNTEFKAQAKPLRPAYGFGESLRVRGLRDTAAGLSTAALAEEMLLEGEGRVRALVSVGGNPINSWPDQLRTREALEKADLVVQIDNQMSETARHADYVIAPKMPFEMAGMTSLMDMQSTTTIGYGFTRPWAAFTPALVEAPEGSDLIEDWEFFYELARRMNLPLGLGNKSAFTPLDMDRKPRSEELFECMTSGSAIPLSRVAEVPGGAVFENEPIRVAEKDLGCETRLDVGNNDMMHDLTELAASLKPPAGPPTARHEEPERAYRLLSRRLPYVYNSTGANGVRVEHKTTGNPLFMNPSDMAKSGWRVGDEVRIVSDRATISGIVEADPGLRRGTVSMSHCFGGTPERDEEVREIGATTNRLACTEDRWDRYNGIPVMSNLPVDIISPPG